MENLNDLMHELVEIVYGQDSLLCILEQLSETYHEKNSINETEALAYFVWYYLGRQRKDLQNIIDRMDYCLIHLHKGQQAQTTIPETEQHGEANQPPKAGQ